MKDEFFTQFSEDYNMLMSRRDLSIKYNISEKTVDRLSKAIGLERPQGKIQMLLTKAKEYALKNNIPLPVVKNEDVDTTDIEVDEKKVDEKKVEEKKKEIKKKLGVK